MTRFPTSPGWFASIRWWHEIMERDADLYERRTIHPVVAWRAAHCSVGAGVRPVVLLDIETLVNLRIDLPEEDRIDSSYLQVIQSSILRVWFEPANDWDKPTYLAALDSDAIVWCEPATLSRAQ